VGPELMGGLDLWPVHRMGIMFRYMHGLRPIRDQNVVLWPEVYATDDDLAYHRVRCPGFPFTQVDRTWPFGQ
jgi:hypothetical protein